jgi:anti-sigma factor RsiW
MMRCPNELELQSLLDAELASWQSRAIERHLAICPDCRAKLAQLKQVVVLLQQGMGREPLPTVETVETQSYYFRPSYVAAAAVLIISLFTAGYLTSKKQNEWSPEAQLMQEYLTIYNETVSGVNRT